MRPTLPAPSQVGIQTKPGASQGIGAGVTKAFINRGYNVVANSLNFKNSTFAPTERLALVEGNIGAKRGIRFNGRCETSPMADSPSRNSLDPIGMQRRIDNSRGGAEYGRRRA